VCPGLLLGLLAIGTEVRAAPFAGNDIVANAASDIAATVAARCSELEGDHAAVANLVDTLILPHFDMQRGSRAILAKDWDSATPVDRDRFVEDFYDYLVASYGDFLLYFRPTTLRVLPFEGDPARSPAHVKTILTLNDGTEVDVDFVMIGTDADWRVIDIVAEGVSYVRTYRSQFHVDIATDGLRSVLEWLEQKATQRPPPAKSYCAATGGRGQGTKTQ
jgi:phospholipid transport system substrate-binding protein